MVWSEIEMGSQVRMLHTRDFKEKFFYPDKYRGEKVSPYLWPIDLERI